MKKLSILLAFLVWGVALFGQGSSPQQTPVVSNGVGQPIPNAFVAICTVDPGPNPAGVCGSLALTYTDSTLGTLCSGAAETQFLNNRTSPAVGLGCSNPGMADQNGNVIAFTTAGTYFCEYYGPTIVGFVSLPCVAPGASGGSSPLTTKGDIFTFSTINARLPVGVDGLCLKADSTQTTGLNWQACGGGGGGSPAGPTGAGQYNNGGSFGGITTTWLPNALNFNSSTGKVTLDAVNSIRYVTTDYNWSQAPAGTVAVGANTVTLTPSPAGMQVIGAPWQPHTSVHIGTVGTPEDVVVTATTCALIGGPGACTITFTAANVHGAGFTIGSSSSGIQEAINAGSFIQTGYTRAGDSLVIIPPGEYTATATISMPSFAPQYLQGYGAVLTCNMSAHCLFVGDPINPTLSGQKVVEGLTFRPGVANGFFSAIADNSQHTTVSHIQSAIVRSVGANSFGSLYLGFDDESAVVDHVDTTQNYSWAHCSTDFCSTAIKTTPGLATVLTVSNSNLSMQCAGNGLDYQSGNTLSVTNTIFQGYAQFGARTSASFSTLPSGIFSHDYWEPGTGCVNPMYGTGGSAGLIVEGGFVTIQSSNGPTGHSPNFASTGGTVYNYYVVTHSTIGGVGAPMLLGTALTNGAGNITISWPQLGTAGVITYDILRTSGSLLTTPFPYTVNCGGGTPTTCGSVTTALAAAAACLTTIDSIVMCTFTDNAAANTTAYTVAVPTYSAGVQYWPASVAYIAAGDSTGSSPSPAVGIYLDKAGANIASSTVPPVSIPVTNVGIWLPRLFAQACDTVPGIFMTCLDAEWKADAGGSTLLWNGLYNQAAIIGRKGRLNFEEGIYNGGVINGGEIITLADSNPFKTLSTTGYTPAQDAADTYIGLDVTVATVATSAQLAIGAPISQSRYINSTPDNTNWKERLTGTLDTWTVPHQFNGSTSGSAQIGVAAIAGTPAKINLPIATSAAGGLLTSDGATPQQTSWTLTPSLTSLTLGGGTAVSLIKFATDTPGAITVNAQTCTDRGVAIAGSSVTATIQASAAYALDANIIVAPGQAVAGTAHYRLCNPTGANITLNAAAAFNISVIQ